MDVSPDKQNIDQVFSHTRYLIDFYQREYKWDEEQVTTLLDDISYKFNLAYNPQLEANQRTMSRYPWYYLNTYVTNKVEGELFLVDGQQRLTTLTLILIWLYHRCDSQSEDLRQWLSQKVVSFGAAGRTFWMGAGKREKVLSKLFEDSTIDPGSAEDLTSTNIVRNYGTVSRYLASTLDTDHRFRSFVFYFLQRLVMVRLDVDQDDVAMVFEVINDRGIGLKSHEILKGKLLGQIDKMEVDQLNNIWEAEITPLDANGRADDFFSTYFKSRFADSRTESHRFEGGYHRTIYEPKYNDVLRFKVNEDRQIAVRHIKGFVRSELPFFATLYKRIQEFITTPSQAFMHVYFNGLNDMDAQNVLLLAACEYGDPLVETKIEAVANEFDRMYVLLQLNKSYDSNQFGDAIYKIRGELHGIPSEAYRQVFDAELFRMINRRRNTEVAEPLSYAYFRELSFSDFNQRFLRYLLARVELFISTGIERELQESLYNLVRNNGTVHGYHVEHILGRNSENEILFGSNEEEFERERNRLGGLLLLRGPDNQSSGAEVYEEKLGTYAGTLYWNQTLCDSFYKSKLQTSAFIAREGLALEPIPDQFGPESLEARTKVLFEIVHKLYV